MDHYQGYALKPFSDQVIRNFERVNGRKPENMTELAIWLFEQKYNRPPEEVQVTAGSINCGPIEA